MIERLAGRCVKKHSMGIVLDINGVGYGIELSPLTAAKIQEESDVILWIYNHLSEDSNRLFGFQTYDERQVFAMLLGVSRLGPKIALAIMATFNLPQLLSMIEEENAVMLAQVPGIGAQSAKKFILELKPKLIKMNLRPLSWKVGDQESWALQKSIKGPSLDMLLSDIKSALQNLGYKDREILPVLQKLETEYKGSVQIENLSFESLLRLAIQRLGRQHKGGEYADSSLF